MVIRPWWYSVWRDLQRGQAAMGVVEKAWGREDGRLLRLGHVWRRSSRCCEREQRGWGERRWLGHACIIICPGQDTMHEAAFGSRLCSDWRLFSESGRARAWCRVGQDVRNEALLLVWRHEWFITEEPL